MKVLSVLAVSALLTGCATGGPTDSLEEPRDLTVREQAVAAETQRFGLNLLAQLGGADPARNVLISPLSVSLALGMTLNGAAGSTRAELQDVLGLRGLDAAGVNAAYRGLLSQLRGRDRRVTFTIANSVWYHDSFEVEPDFLAEAEQSFGAAVRPLDFARPDAPATINRWVNEATGGRIPEIVETIRDTDRLFLVNAVYFKAPWSSPFEKQATRAGPFTLSDDRTVQAQLMSQDGGFRSYLGADVHAAELLYGDSAYSMLLVRPRTGSVDALVRTLTPAVLDGWLGRLELQRVLLVLPRFRFEYGEQLKPALQALGVRAAFDPRTADFSGINRSAEDLHVSSVLHRTFIAVDEEGTEAAAATSVTIGVTSLPPTLAFDRPFLFLIRERASGTVMFAGIVRDPTQE
jgi:serpin B